MWILYGNNITKFDMAHVKENCVLVSVTYAYGVVGKYEKPEQAELALNMIARAISEDKKVFRMPNQTEIETASEGSIRDYTMLYNLCTRFHEVMK